MGLPIQPKHQNPFITKTDEELELERKYKQASDQFITNVLKQVPNLTNREWSFKTEDSTLTVNYSDFSKQLIDSFYRRVKTALVYDPVNLEDNLINYNEQEGYRYFDQIAYNLLLSKLLSQSADRQLANGFDVTYTDSSGTSQSDSQGKSTASTKSNNTSNSNSTNEGSSDTTANGETTVNGLNTTTGTTANTATNESTNQTNSTQTGSVNTKTDNATDKHTDTNNHGAQSTKVDSNTAETNSLNETEGGSTTVEVSAPGSAQNVTTNVYDKSNQITHRLSYDGSTEDEERLNPAAGSILSSTSTQQVTPSKTVTTPNSTKTSKSTSNSNGTNSTTTAEYADSTDYGKQHSVTTNDQTNSTKNDSSVTVKGSTSSNGSNNSKNSSYNDTVNKNDTKSTSTNKTKADSTTTGTSTTDSSNSSLTNSSNQNSVKTVHISNSEQLYKLMNEYSRDYQNGIQLWLDGMFSYGIFTF